MKCFTCPAEAGSVWGTYMNWEVVSKFAFRVSGTFKKFPFLVDKLETATFQESASTVGSTPYLEWGSAKYSLAPPRLSYGTLSWT